MAFWMLRWQATRDLAKFAPPDLPFNSNPPHPALRDHGSKALDMGETLLPMKAGALGALITMVSVVG